MRMLAIASILCLIPAVAMAASNPQRIIPGRPYPVYVNNTGTNQTMAKSTYVNQTQYTPAAPSTAKLMFRTSP